MPACVTQSTTGHGSRSSAIPSARPSTPPFAGAATAMPAPCVPSRTACSRSPAPCSETRPATGLHSRRRIMRPDLVSRRGPTARSTAACALRPGAAATVIRQLASDPLVAVSQRTHGITAGLARDVAPSNPGSGRRVDTVLPFAPLGKVGADRGREHFLALPGAMLGRHPPARPATHCPARPTPRCGVTAPLLTPLTNGGMWTPPGGQVRLEN